MGCISSQMKKYIFLIFVFLPKLSVGADHSEKWYQEKWCNENNGKTEVVLSDRTRVDCLTNKYAIEFDFGKKWSEAIGQSLGYSIETQKQPSIVLILEKPKDYKYWIKLNTVIDFYRLPIKTWKIENYTR